MALFECLSCNEEFLDSDRFRPLKRDENGEETERFEDVEIPLCTVNCLELTNIGKGRLVHLFAKDGKKTGRAVGHLYTSRKKSELDGFVTITTYGMPWPNSNQTGPVLNPEYEERNPWEANDDQYATIFVANCCSCNGHELHTLVEEAGSASKGPRWGVINQGESILELESSYASWCCNGVRYETASASENCRVIFNDSAPITLTRLETGMFVEDMNCCSGRDHGVDEYGDKVTWHCWHHRGDGKIGGYCKDVWPYQATIQLHGKVIGSGYVCGDCC